MSEETLRVLIVEDDPTYCSAASRRWPWKTSKAMAWVVPRKR